MAWLTETQKIGAVFAAGGVFFMCAGVVFFFDRAMLSMGNILLLIALPLLLGTQAALGFFLRRDQLHGTAAFAVGVALVLFRWVFFGFALELFGLFVLVRERLILLAQITATIPVVGPYLSRFFVTASAAADSVSAKSGSSSSLPV